MLWRDFEPYVMPYVIGCPLPVMEHHARLTAIDWCRKTLCLQRTLDPELANGTTHEIDIAPPTGMQIVRPMDVAVDGRERHLATGLEGIRLARSSTQHEFAYTTDNQTLLVYPLEAAGAQVVITAALMPALGTSTGLDDDIALEHADDIAKGIAAAVMGIPKQAFTDHGLAALKKTEYEQRRAIVAAKYSRGIAAAKLRTPTPFF
jgi:hypothetical protein